MSVIVTLSDKKTGERLHRFETMAVHVNRHDLECWQCTGYKNLSSGKADDLRIYSFTSDIIVNTKKYQAHISDH